VGVPSGELGKFRLTVAGCEAMMEEYQAIRSGPLQLADDARYLGRNDIDCRAIRAVGQNDIGVTLGWLDELLVHRGAYRFQILIDDALYRAAAFGNIPLHAADEADVGAVSTKIFSDIMLRKSAS
jgi:hypothetical protein